MFKKHSDFKEIGTRDPAHPGTPVRQGKSGDVWQNKHGQFFVISAGGDRLQFGSIEDAEAHTTAVPTPPAKPAPAK